MSAFSYHKLEMSILLSLLCYLAGETLEPLWISVPGHLAAKDKLYIIGKGALDWRHFFHLNGKIEKLHCMFQFWFVQQKQSLTHGFSIAIDG